MRRLWRLVLVRRRMVAAWRRWHAKLPHNRVKRERIRNPQGQVVGYTQPVPIPEPPLPAVACRLVARPSGRVEVELAGPSGKDLRRLQEGYRLARRRKTSGEEFEPLQVKMSEVAAWLAVCDG